MKRFAQASDAQFADLERRAINGCVRFFDVELPQGAIPNRAMIGFEVDSATRCASLLVQRGVHYTGPSRQVAEWLGNGEKVCPNFAALQQWILTQVCPEFPTTPALEPSRPPLSAHQLTDLTAVTASARSRHIQSYVPPDEIVRRFSPHVCGQITALTELSGRVSRHLARVNPRRPLTFMAIGPTGTGKTKTAEALPIVLHEIDETGSGYGYLRVDCSELVESHRVSQLLGAPPGYVGHDDGAPLIDQLAANPRTLVLFDEIEKAHPDVLKVLLNAIDCGRLSGSARNGNGHSVDARRAIFYFTTNLECERIFAELHTRNAYAKPEIIEHVCRGKLRAAGLKPELVGRITSFLLFHPLTNEIRAEIAVLSIVRIAQEYGLHVERVAPETIRSILSFGQTADFGARPIEFLIDNKMGEIFAKAAAAEITVPLEIAGAGPFICNALTEKRTAVRSEAASPP